MATVDIYQLNLPQPSSDFLNTIKHIVDHSQLDADAKRWFDQQNSVDNSAEYLFLTQASIDQLVQQEFGQYFQQPIGGIVGIMKNSHPVSSNHSPHIDRGRSLAINYYIELGGDSVTTTFYDTVENTNLDQAKNFTYQQVSNQKIGSVVFKKNHWYAFDACRCHSIENITGLRYFVAIHLKNINSHSYRVQNLVQDYASLLADPVAVI